jgi:hypothetical protein
MMEPSRHPIDVIARQLGFACGRIRRGFPRAFGQPPWVIRRNALRRRRQQLLKDLQGRVLALCVTWHRRLRGMKSRSRRQG